MGLLALAIASVLSGHALAASSATRRADKVDWHRFVRATTPDGKYVPDQYQLCGSEGEVCECNGVVIFGDPITNRWSEPIKGDGEIDCKASTFKKYLQAPNPRECWCKPSQVAKKADYPQEIPDLSTVEYTSENIADGLTWKSEQGYDVFGVPQAFDLLIVDPNKRELELSFSEPGLKTTSAMILEHGGMAGVNGGFHAYGRPDIGTITMMRVDGEDIVYDNTPEEWDLTSEDVEGVAVITSSGRLEIVSQGEKEKWIDAPTFLHVGPLLMLEGVRQPVDSKTWNHVRNPRTGLCTLKSGKEALITVDGRYYYASGMTVPEFALFMQAIGCKDGINLDGGGSTTMWIEGKGTVNEPRDKPASGQQWDESLTERSISNAFVVV